MSLTSLTSSLAHPSHTVSCAGEAPPPAVCTRYLHGRFAAGCVALLDAHDLGAQDEGLSRGGGLLERGLQEGDT